MSVAILKTPAPSPPGMGELVPTWFDTDLIITPADNPTYNQAMLADLLASMTTHGQLVPGFVFPSPELADDERYCAEGTRRLEVARLLRKKFWAFDLGRPVDEQELIELVFQHNLSRRVMTREEIAARAARYIEITGAPAAQAAKILKISEATLSRAFGDRRIPEHLKPKAELLGLTIRSLVAAVAPELMARVIDFAITSDDSGRKPTRDQVSAFIRDVKKTSKPKGRKPKEITLRLNGRTVTLTVDDKDSANSVAEDLKAIGTKLGKLTDVKPEGWPFLFA
jgi:hypothetical protein